MREFKIYIQTPERTMSIEKKLTDDDLRLIEVISYEFREVSNDKLIISLEEVKEC